MKNYSQKLLITLPILGLTLFYYVLTLFSLIFPLAAATERFDGAMTDVTVSEKFFITLGNILSFPLIHLGSYLDGEIDMSVIIGNIFVITNCLLWALLTYFIVRMVVRQVKLLRHKNGDVK